jgi:hypothetical protein
VTYSSGPRLGRFGRGGFLGTAEPGPGPGPGGGSAAAWLFTNDEDEPYSGGGWYVVASGQVTVAPDHNIALITYATSLGTASGDEVYIDPTADLAGYAPDFDLPWMDIPAGATYKSMTGAVMMQVPSGAAGAVALSLGLFIGGGDAWNVHSQVGVVLAAQPGAARRRASTMPGRPDRPLRLRAADMPPRRARR